MVRAETTRLGLSPRSWEGWIATALCLAGFAVSLSTWQNTVAAIGCLVILAIVVLITTDPPGAVPDLA